MKNIESYDPPPNNTLLKRTQNIHNDMKVITTFNAQICLSTTSCSSIAF